MATGDNIRRHRKAKGFTQAQLADAVGLTEGAIRHYESGIRAVKPELLEKIAKALEVSEGTLKDYGVEDVSRPHGPAAAAGGRLRPRPQRGRHGPGGRPQGAACPQARAVDQTWAEKRAELERGELDEDAYADWKASF